MSSATAQELAVRTAVATVADTATLLQKVDSAGRLYAPITKAQLVIDMSLVPGSDVQAYDAGLDSLSDLSYAEDGFIKLTAEDTFAVRTYTQVKSDLSLVIGSDVQAHGDVLDDLNTLGANAADGEFLVGTNGGVLDWESGNTARTSLGLGSGDSPTFNQGTINSSPGADTAIATKGYVDSLGGGGSTFWTSVAAATTENIDLANDLENGDTIDGWILVTGDRVLVKDQTDATENGLYSVVASGAASRSADADTADEIVSRKCIVLHGNTNEDKLFFCATAPITLGVTNIEFSGLAGGGAYGIIELLGDEVEVSAQWDTPASVDDPESEWANEGVIIDGNLETEDHHFMPDTYDWAHRLEFTVPESDCTQIRISCHQLTYSFYIRAHYYDGSWHTITTGPGYQGCYIADKTEQAWLTIPLGGTRRITKFKFDFCTSYIYTNCFVWEVEYWRISATEQHKITLEAGTPTTDFIITFPDDDGDANQAMLSDGSGVLSWGGHDDLADFLATEHFLQTAITNVSTALSTGLLKVTTGTGALTVVADASGNWNTAVGWGDHAGLYDATGTAAAAITTHLGNFAHGDIATNKAHADTTHDYAYITGNDGATGITAAELEELSDGSQTTLHSHAPGAATFLDLTDTPASYDSADIGKYVKVKDDLSGLEFDTPALPAHTIASHSDTTGTGAELDELTDGSQTTLHSHAGAGSSFLDLTDTPASYDTGDIGKFAKVKDDLSGLEFSDILDTLHVFAGEALAGKIFGSNEDGYRGSIYVLDNDHVSFYAWDDNDGGASAQADCWIGHPTTASKALIVKANGCVGFGTDNPLAECVISVDGDEGYEVDVTEDLIYLTAYDRGVDSKYIQIHSRASDFVWSIAGSATKRAVLDAANGYFGVGLDAPQEHVHLYGAGPQRLEVESSQAESAVLKLTNITGSYGIYSGGGTDGLFIYDYGETAQRFAIFGDGKTLVGSGTAKTLLTVEGTLTLKEQAAADGDTAAYGQVWVKSDTPCTLWFTNDDGGEVHLGAVEASLSFVIDGGGEVIETGVKGDLEVPFACEITCATLLADVSGAIKIDIWKDTYANFPPDNGDTITGANEPEIAASGTKDQDATLTNWTTSISAGDILRFNVDSCATITRVTLALKVNRTY